MSDAALDPRLATATAVAGLPGVLPGDQLVRVEQVQIDGQAVVLPAPIPGVPDYIAAAESEAKADSLRPWLTANLDRRGEIPYQPDTGAVFGFYAAAGSAVTAAVAGLEGFANHHVGRFVGAAGVAEYRGEPYTRRQLWDLPLNERLGDVLPCLSGLGSPKQEPWWPTLRRVQAVAALSRHGITQPTKRSGLAGERSLTQRYCDGEYRGAAGMMLEVFEYLAPDWVGADRLAQLPTPPNPS